MTPPDGRVAQMTAYHIDEGRIALGGPDGGEMTDQPDCGTDEPQPEAQSNRGRERAVEDRHGPRRTAKQDRLCERAVDRRVETHNGLIGLH
jgi:hypothetical protein